MPSNTITMRIPPNFMERIIRKYEEHYGVTIRRNGKIVPWDKKLIILKSKSEREKELAEKKG